MISNDIVIRPKPSDNTANNVKRTAKSHSTNRINWIDNLKALGIVLVIFAHIVPADTQYIYSFHVPIFFFISGYLVKDHALLLPWRTFLHKNFKALIVPYIVIGLATYLFWLLILRHFGENLELNIPPHKPLIGMLTGLGTDRLLQHNPPLWFLPCLFMTTLIFSALRRLTNNPIAIAAVLLLLAVIGFSLPEFINFRLFWNFDVALVAVAFYGVGYLLKRQQDKWMQFQMKMHRIIILIVALLIVQLWLLRDNGRVDMFYTWYGNHIIRFFGAAFLGIAFWSIISAFLPSTKITRLIAKESLALFLLHKVAFQIITGVAVFGLGFSSSFKDEGLIVAMVYTVLSIVMILPAALLIKRYAPWILGQSKFA